MKIRQGRCYTVDGASSKVYVRKIKYVGNSYTMACIEFVTKNGWRVIDMVKNAKLYHDRISHWELLEDEV